MSSQHFQLNVPLSLDQIIDIVRQLSPIEKLQLSGVLWDETAETEINIPEEHQQMVNERLKRMKTIRKAALAGKILNVKLGCNMGFKLTVTQESGKNAMYKIRYLKNRWNPIIQ